MAPSSPRPQQRPLAPVQVSEQLKQHVPHDEIARAIAQLRSAGADCWACAKRIQIHEESAMQLHITSVAGRLGFTHARCAPPGVLDDRRNRRAAIHAQERLLDAATDMLAFLSVREYPAPRSVVVLSAQNPVRHLFEEGAVSFLTEGAMIMGMEPVAPPVMDAVPTSDARWSVRLPDPGHMLVECDGSAFYDGEVSVLAEWSEAVAREGTTVVLFAGIGLRSSVAGNETWNLLERFAHQGHVVGVTATAKS
jgi:hypothetical protein